MRRKPGYGPSFPFYRQKKLLKITYCYYWQNLAVVLPSGQTGYPFSSFWDQIDVMQPLIFFDRLLEGVRKGGRKNL